jgi:hypothetical protein
VIKKKTLMLSIIGLTVVLGVGSLLVLANVQELDKPDKQEAYATVQRIGGLCADGICKSEVEYFYDEKIKQIVDNLDLDNLPQVKRKSCQAIQDRPDTFVQFPYKTDDKRYNVSCNVQLPQELLDLLNIKI